MNWIPISTGDRLELRKAHPCGSREWTVTRTGADIGLQCVGCGRRVMIGREEVERRIKRILPETESVQAESAGTVSC